MDAGLLSSRLSMRALALLSLFNFLVVSPPQKR